MSQPTQLLSLHRQPTFRRSAGVATGAYVMTVLSSIAITVGLENAPVLTGLGGAMALAALLWGGQAVHRLAANIDVAAEGVYADHHARSAEPSLVGDR